MLSFRPLLEELAMLCEFLKTAGDFISRIDYIVLFSPIISVLALAVTLYSARAASRSAHAAERAIELDLKDKRRSLYKAIRRNLDNVRSGLVPGRGNFGHAVETELRMPALQDLILEAEFLFGGDQKPVELIDELSKATRRYLSESGSSSGVSNDTYDLLKTLDQKAHEIFKPYLVVN